MAENPFLKAVNKPQITSRPSANPFLASVGVMKPIEPEEGGGVFGYLGEKAKEFGQAVIKPFTQSPIQTYKDIIKGAQESSAQMGAELGTSVRDYYDTVFKDLEASPVKKISASADLLTKSLGALFSPVSTAFQAGEQLPVINALLKPVGIVFDATGKIGGWSFGKVLDQIPGLSDESKEILREPVEGLGELTGQIALGGRVLKLAEGRFAKKGTITPKDAFEISEIAKREAEISPKTEIAPIANQPPKAPEIAQISPKIAPETITLYRAAPKFPSDSFNKGTYFADTEQSARFYSESHYKGDPGDIKVEQFTLPKDSVFKEPSTGNYILKGEAPVSRTISKELDPLAQEARKYKSAGLKFESGGDQLGDEFHGFIRAKDKSGKTVGSVDYTFFQGETAVKMIEVKPEFRRQGMGIELLKKLQSESDKPIIAQGDFATKEGRALFQKFKMNGLVEKSKTFDDFLGKFEKGGKDSWCINI